MPEEFLADIVMNKNVIYKKLKELFRTAQPDKVSGRLFSMIGELKQKLTEKFQWDFTGLDSEDEEEKPLHRVRPDGTCECRRRVTCAMDDAWWKSSRHRMSQETVTGRFPSSCSAGGG
ncbi:hypothetical protein EVAR_78206_1 [Eumeta japonica]|uniref:AAR2 C-terminal domain-containing protein n=1 Tax=Eumeta variegata TaxID=151549 RepID=A0A4C2A594_EUMVA|nr:hypothetical protein EVAR_78206_1 [Eumeta japonica]